VRALVTGGRGFIGRRVCERLAALGHEVRALDNGWRSDAALPDGVTAFDADVRDRVRLDEACAGVDLVVHLAAIQGTANFYRDPALVLDVNLRGVLNVAEAAASAGVQRLVFSSSSEVYGIPVRFPTPETEPLQVPDPLNPRWSYGGSKLAGELVVANLARAAGYDFTILRYHNVYGPAMGWDHVIPQFIRRLELDEEFTIQGDGEQQRSFCYVDDAVDATLAAAVKDVARGQIFNIGNPDGEVSINALVALLEEISGKDVQPRHVPFEGEGTRRRVPDIARARQLLGYSPGVSLPEGLKRTYAWYAEELRRQPVRSSM
jgi:nucleoside-diphosphate-sugar epimerase